MAWKQSKMKTESGKGRGVRAETRNGDEDRTQHQVHTTTTINQQDQNQLMASMAGSLMMIKLGIVEEQELANKMT